METLIYKAAIGVLGVTVLIISWLYSLAIEKRNHMAKRIDQAAQKAAQDYAAKVELERKLRKVQYESSDLVERNEELEANLQAANSLAIERGRLLESSNERIMYLSSCLEVYRADIRYFKTQCTKARNQLGLSLLKERPGRKKVIVTKG